MTMSDTRLELPQGTLDLLILKAVALEPLHGWAISERLQQISRSALQVQQGSLYPALHRLERRGWVKAKWAISENNQVCEDNGKRTGAYRENCSNGTLFGRLSRAFRRSYRKTPF
jgi:hypothetical protein